MRNFHIEYRNYLELFQINELAVKSPESFVMRCEKGYRDHISDAADTGRFAAWEFRALSCWQARLPPARRRLRID